MIKYICFKEGEIMIKTTRRFIYDLKKYWKYIIYATKSKLKAEVATSHLNWLWWILDPIFFMLIYTFIVKIVFKTSEPNFPVFVFIGLTVWNFFNKTISTSTREVKKNKNIVAKVYLPKFILLLIIMFVNLFKMFISWGIIIIMMIIFKVPLSLSLLYFIPLLLTTFVVTFGISSIILHFGVFVDDLQNVMNILLKLAFYLSGVFYSIETRVPSPYNSILVKLNPAAFLMSSFRNTILFSTAPNILVMVIWFIIGCVLSIIGISTIYKYENSYAKVIQ